MYLEFDSKLERVLSALGGGENRQTMENNLGSHGCPRGPYRPFLGISSLDCRKKLFITLMKYSYLVFSGFFFHFITFVFYVFYLNVYIFFMYTVGCACTFM